MATAPAPTQTSPTPSYDYSAINYLQSRFEAGDDLETLTKLANTLYETKQIAEPVKRSDIEAIVKYRDEGGIGASFVPNIPRPETPVSAESDTVPAGVLPTASPMPETEAPSLDGLNPYLDRLYAGVGDIAAGVGDIAGIVGNPLNALINAAFGTNLSTDLGGTLREATGAPEGDPLVSAINRAASGSLVGAGGAGLLRNLPGVAGIAATEFAAQPIVQTVSGGTAGAASELARQQGAGIVGQTGAAMVGALLGNKAATAYAPARAVAPTLARTVEAATPPAAAMPEVPPAPAVTPAQKTQSIGRMKELGLTEPLARGEVTRKVADFAAEYITEAGLGPRPKDIPFMDYFRQHFNANTLPPEKVQELFKKFDIRDEQDWTEIVTGVRASVSDFGRNLAYLKHAADKIPPAVAELSNTLSKELPTPSLWVRAGNAMRGSYVADIAKTTRDMVSAAVNVPIDVYTNLVDNSINAVLNPVRRSVGAEARPVNFGDSFVLLTEQFKGKQKQQLFDQLKRNAPKLNREILDTYDRADVARPVGKDAFGKVEKAVDFFNFANRWSDGFVRKAVFPALLRREATRKGFDYDAMVAAEKIHTLPEEVLQKAIDETLNYVYARRPGKGGPLFLGELSEKVVNLVDKAGPIGAATVGFPRFIANALNFQYNYGPGILRALTPKGAKRVLAGDSEVLAKGITGLTLLYTAMQFQDSEYAGSKWYTAKRDDGTEVDLRPYFPSGYYLLLADLIKRYKDGTIDVAYTTADILQGLTGAQFRAGSALYIADDLMRDLRNAASIGQGSMDAVKKVLGSAIGGLLPMGGTIKDTFAAFNPEEAITRDTSPAPFLGAALREVPFAQTKLLGLPEQEYASRETPRGTVDPLLRPLVGATIRPAANIIEREMRSLGFEDFDLYKSEGFPALDRRAKELIGAIADTNAEAYFNSPEYRNADKLTQTEMFRDFYKGVRAASRDILKNENENFAALTWYNDQSREDKIRLNEQYKVATGKNFSEYYSQLIEAPLVTQEEYDALPKGAKFTDPGDYKVYEKK